MIFTLSFYFKNINREENIAKCPPIICIFQLKKAYHSKFQTVYSKFQIVHSKFQIIHSKFQIVHSKFQIVHSKFQIVNSV